MLKAKLLPLEGKYYGSIIEVDTPTGKTEIKVWHSADFIPSQRELDKQKMAIEEYRENSELSDSHFESHFTHKLCEYLVICINHMPTELLK